MVVDNLDFSSSEEASVISSARLTSQAQRAERSQTGSASNHRLNLQRKVSHLESTVPSECSCHKGTWLAAIRDRRAAVHLLTREPGSLLSQSVDRIGPPKLTGFGPCRQPANVYRSTFGGACKSFPVYLFFVLCVWLLRLRVGPSGADPASGLPEDRPPGLSPEQVPASQAEAPQRGEEKEPERGVDLLSQVFRKLEVEFPDRVSVVEHSTRVAEACLGAGRTEGEETWGRARLAASEVLLLGGREKEAKQLLEEVVRRSSVVEERAQALYMLGSLYFFRGRYVSPAPVGPGPGLPSAKAYWEVLVERFGDTKWAKSVERPLRYLRLLMGEVPRDVRGAFELGDRTHEISLAELRGKVVGLVYWRFRTKAFEKLESACADDLRAALGSSGGVEGRVAVLGIHLGPKSGQPGGREAASLPPWPVLHDPAGFETPFARELGIPSAPHFVLLDEDGRPIYVGIDGEAFRSALSRELKRLEGSNSSEPR